MIDAKDRNKIRKNLPGHGRDFRSPDSPSLATFICRADRLFRHPGRATEQTLLAALPRKASANLHRGITDSAHQTAQAAFSLDPARFGAAELRAVALSQAAGMSPAPSVRDLDRWHASRFDPGNGA